MAKGLGILDEFDHELAAELNARLTPEQRQANAEKSAADEFIFRALDNSVAEEIRRAEAEKLQPELDAIDAALAPHLKEQLAEENAAKRISPKAKQDFAIFQKYVAKEWDLSSLPASPQAVAVFLADHLEGGAAHVVRLCRSISTVHKAVGFKDPTEDVLVRAIVRLARTDKSKPQTEKE